MRISYPGGEFVEITGLDVSSNISAFVNTLFQRPKSSTKPSKYCPTPMKSPISWNFVDPNVEPILINPGWFLTSVAPAPENELTEIPSTKSSIDPEFEKTNEIEYHVLAEIGWEIQSPCHPEASEYAPAYKFPLKI